MKKFFLFLSLSGFCWGWAAAQQQLPISRVLLYKNGMAYLVRSGAIQQPLSLSFHPEDMKDVLKTFTAWNPDSGSLYSVGYTTGVPIAQILSRFPFSLSNSGGGLAHFLGQIQGADLRLNLSSRTISGKLVAISREQHAVDQQTLVNDHLLSVFQSGGAVQTVWLSDVDSVQLTDPELNHQLETYLSILAEGNQDVTREITIYPNPQTGPINVAYIQQFPVWKTSYRVQLSGAEAWIQGWAQIDNPTGEAWNNVNLTLISGMPVSFIMDLYQPLYTSRTTLEVPGAQLAAPRRYEAAVKTRPEPSAPLEERAAKDERRFQLRAAKAAVALAAEAPLSDLLPRQEAGRFAEAKAAQIQDYFEYRFPFPVQLASRQSALLPFVKKKISLEPVSIFNPTSDKNHPLTGAWLENNTGVPLEAGPITFFVEGRYAGEAVLNYLSRDERRLVSYGVDYDIEIFTERKSQPETTVRLIIKRGTVLFEKERIQTTLYQLKNKATKEKAVLIEHPKKPGRELKNVKPLETTENFFRFRVKLSPGQELGFPVAEIVSRQTRLSVRELNRRQLEVHFAGLKIPPELRQKLEEIVAAREKIASLQKQVQSLDQEIDSIFRDQTRLRENLRALGRTEEEKQLRQRYLNQMNQQENRIEQVRRNRSNLTQQIADQEGLLSQ
ncbi:hypothetical protein MYX84_12880, partial [Acidobacteria bacterium AH-259-O06]|nr:hypothetical protein [Acidobacteria bacterium AH-259-O06]